MSLNAEEVILTDHRNGLHRCLRVDMCSLCVALYGAAQSPRNTLERELRELQTVELPRVSRQIKELREAQQILLRRERAIRGQLLDLNHG